MLENLAEGKQIKAEERKIDYQHCEECDVERIMYPHWGFYVCLSRGVPRGYFHIRRTRGLGP